MELNLNKEPNTGKEQKLVVAEVNASIRVNKQLLNKDGSVIMTGKDEIISINSFQTTSTIPGTATATESEELVVARETAKKAVADALGAYYLVLSKQETTNG